MTTLNVDEWDIESVRVTFFGPPGTFGRHQQYWRTLIGSDPEIVSGRPAEGLFSEEGSFREDVRLVISGAVGRVDIMLSPQLSPVWPTIGKFGSVMQSILSLVDAGGTLFNSAHRIALGVTANLRVNDRENGYAVLASLLHDVSVSSDMHDLFFQVNYPKELKSYPVSANRISRWMAGALQLSSQPDLNVELGDMVRVEIDLNTFQKAQLKLADALLQEVLSEFSSLAKDILEQGNTH